MADYATSQGHAEIDDFLRSSSGWSRLRYSHAVGTVAGADAGVSWADETMRAGHMVDEEALVAAESCVCAACRRVLRGREPWSPEVHGLFPAAARAEAKRVLVASYELGPLLGLPGQELAALLIPLVVVRM